MKRIAIFFASVLLTVYLASAQTDQPRFTKKSSGQREITSDKHLEKELQKKQLSEEPELLNKEVLAKGKENKKLISPSRKSKKGTYIKLKKS